MKKNADNKENCFFCTKPGLKWPKEALVFIKKQAAMGKFVLCKQHREHLEGVKINVAIQEKAEDAAVGNDRNIDGDSGKDNGYTTHGLHGRNNPENPQKAAGGAVADNARGSAERERKDLH